jgi:hypothetical protein
MPAGQGMAAQKTYTLGPDGTLIPVSSLQGQQHHGMQQQQQYGYGGQQQHYGQQQYGQQQYGYGGQRRGGGMNNGVAAGLGAATCCLCFDGCDGF